MISTMILVESMIMFVFGMALISGVSFLLRISFSGKIFKFFFGSVIISSLLHFITITNPQQNSILLLFIVSIFYVFLFYIIKILKKDAKKVWKIPFQGVFIIFIFFILIFGKGEFLETKSINISPEFDMSLDGTIFYKSMGLLKSDIGVFNEYGDKVYDTIKYDINLDGFVDIKTIDKDDDGIIDKIVVKTYTLQKYILFIVLLIFIGVSYIYSDGGKESKGDNTKGKKKILFHLKQRLLKVFRKKEKQKIDTKNIKKYTSFVLLLSILFSLCNVNIYIYAAEEEEILLGTGEMNYLENLIKQDCEKNPFNDSQCVYVNHFTRMYLQSSTKTAESIDLFHQIIEEELRCYKDSYACSGDETKARWALESKWRSIFMDEYRNTYPHNKESKLGSKSIMDSNYTWRISGNPVSLEERAIYLFAYKTKLLDEKTAQIKLEQSKTPEYKRGEQILSYLIKVESCKGKNCRWISETVQLFYKDYYQNLDIQLQKMYDNALSTKISFCTTRTLRCGTDNKDHRDVDTLIEMLVPDMIKKNLPNFTIEGHEDFGVLEEDGWKENQDDDNTLITPNSDTNNASDEIQGDIYQNDINNKTDNGDNESAEQNQDVNNQKTDTSGADNDTGKLSEIDEKKLIDEFSTDGKAIIDIASVGLSGINYIFSDGIVRDKKDFIDKKEEIKKVFKKLLGDNGGDTGGKGKTGNIINKFDNISNNIDNVNKKHPGSKKNIISGVQGNVGPIGKALNVIGNIGAVFDIYNDYQDFNKKTGGDTQKTTIATIVTGGLKYLVGANPLDLVLSGISGGLYLLGYEGAAKTVGGYSLGNRAKELVEDAILSESDETMDGMDQILDDFIIVMNDPNAGVFDKSSSAAISTISFTYGTIVFGSSQILSGISGGVTSFFSGVNEIEKVFE